ncbi:MAG: hypothetical protein A3K19_04585 [Lentisphaerae bacterium RIFOXYB12_FULL_65_16]|nr:MAG: hypothetical protein A3K18_01365 [Lentisphaerae bacterium RIFOXYA12_64_32]OGV84596.1 MAG: hypothetical protein A3K19_04585 [Lentisphaerae bacterium RIFOXYB12_FULL_65_16]
MRNAFLGRFKVHHVALDLREGRPVGMPKDIDDVQSSEAYLQIIQQAGDLVFDQDKEKGGAAFICSSGVAGLVRKADIGALAGKPASAVLTKPADGAVRAVQTGDGVVVQTREGKVAVLAVGAFDDRGINLCWFMIPDTNQKITRDEIDALLKEAERLDAELRQKEAARKPPPRKVKPKREDRRPSAQNFVDLAERSHELGEEELRVQFQALLRQGATPSYETSTGFTPLPCAIYRGSLPMVRLLVQNGADIHKEKALGAAVDSGHMDIVQYLIERGGDIREKNVRGESLLQVALRSRNKNEEIIRLLKERGGGVDLHTAVEAGDLEAIRRLVKDGADINAANKKGQTPLDVAVETNRAETCRLLLELGADPGSRGGKPSSAALNGAVSSAKLEVVPLLIPVSPPPVLRAALFTAAYRGNTEIMRQILARLPGPLAPPAEDEDDTLDLVLGAAPEPAMRILEEKGLQLPLGAAARLGRIERLKELLTSGADVNEECDGHDTPLDLAAENGHLAATELLLKAGANPNVWGWHRGGGTPLHRAVRRGDVAMAQLLLSKGARVDAGDHEDIADLAEGIDKGVPPLYYAVQAADEVLVREDDEEDDKETREANAKDRQRKLDMVRVLLEAGANPSLKVPSDEEADKEGNPIPVPLWKTAKSKDLIKLLRKHGAK